MLKLAEVHKVCQLFKSKTVDCNTIRDLTSSAACIELMAERKGRTLPTCYSTREET